jgi:hypothetical protein
MRFDEAQKQLEILTGQLRSRAITIDQFRAAAAGLQVQDESGRWWQPDPNAAGWMVWDGNAWRSQAPPIPLPSPSVVPPVPAAPIQPGAGLSSSGVSAVLKSRGAGQFMDPQAFLETARRLPLGRRPQAWWNLLSVLGGAISGYVWFVYGSVRGLPHLTFLNSGRESWLDWLPSLALAALPVLLIIFRRAVAQKLTPLWNKFGGMSLQAKIGIAVAAVVALWFFQSNNFLFTQREGLDVITPLLMAGIPMMLVLFRRETDKMLAPLQSFRRSIPRGVLVGMGLAVPFLVAFFLYYGVNLRMYPLLRANVLFGTLGSYVLLRNPILSGNTRWTVPKVPGILLAIGVFLYFVAPAMADDFLRDPFNLNDGLRTDGIAPVLSGVATAVVSILVNGVEVAQVMIQGTSPVQEGETPEHKNFLVIVNTMDQTGAMSTTVEQEKGGIYVYAHCEEAGKGRFPSGDSTITYALLDGAPWVTLTDMGTQNGERCAHVGYADPQPTSGTPPESCSVHVGAGAGGGLIGATVKLNLSLAEWELQIL